LKKSVIIRIRETGRCRYKRRQQKGREGKKKEKGKREGLATKRDKIERAEGKRETP